jgi:hypothetical protein
VDDFRQVINLDQLTSDDTVTLARTAAEAIRGLNWTTNHRAGLDQPSVAYDVTAALSLAVSRLPQLLAQITGYLDRALAAGQLGHDLGTDPAPGIRAAGTWLSSARARAAALAADLSQAQQHLAPVNGNPARRAPQDQP